MKRGHLRPFQAACFLATVFVLTGCIATKTDLDRINEKIAAVGSMFGPQGVAASSAISLLLSAGVMIYRNITRKGALTDVATATAGAITQAGKGASAEKVMGILSEGLPGNAVVEPSKMAEKVADAKEVISDAKAAA